MYFAGPIRIAERPPVPKEQRRILVGRKVSTGERELEGDKEDKKERT